MSPRNGRRSICCRAARVDFAAGRGYDRKEYEPFGAPFDDSAELFAEGLEIVWRAWTETGKWSHKGRFYEFEDVEVTAAAGAEAASALCRLLLAAVDGACRAATTGT